MGVIEAPAVIERETPEFPAALAELYGYYRKLRFGRNENKLIPRDPLSFSEINAYAQLMGETIEPWHTDVIMSIDAIFNSRGE